MLPNMADDPLLRNTTILKSLDANQGLKKKKKKKKGTGVSQISKKEIKPN